MAMQSEIGKAEVRRAMAELAPQVSHQELAALARWLGVLLRSLDGPDQPVDDAFRRHLAENVEQAAASPVVRARFRDSFAALRNQAELQGVAEFWLEVIGKLSPDASLAADPPLTPGDPDHMACPHCGKLSIAHMKWCFHCRGLLHPA